MRPGDAWRIGAEDRQGDEWIRRRPRRTHPGGRWSRREGCYSIFLDGTFAARKGFLDTGIADIADPAHGA